MDRDSKQSEKVYWEVRNPRMYYESIWLADTFFSNIVLTLWSVLILQITNIPECPDKRCHHNHEWRPVLSKQRRITQWHHCGLLSKVSCTEVNFCSGCRGTRQENLLNEFIVQMIYTKEISHVSFLCTCHEMFLSIFCEKICWMKSWMWKTGGTLLASSLW